MSIPPTSAPIEKRSTAPAERSLLFFIPSLCSNVTVSHNASMELLMVSRARTPAINNVRNNHSWVFMLRSAPNKIESIPMVS